MFHSLLLYLCLLLSLLAVLLADTETGATMYTISICEHWVTRGDSSRFRPPAHPALDRHQYGYEERNGFPSFATGATMTLPGIAQLPS